ncbi:restriction endonuclease subunit S [Micromonospora chalcea]|uniref:restriction endonuclease subunit S n=1 Tax=Micromonospora chalcea TaxID=1874 RepID=UPI00381B6F05
MGWAIAPLGDLVEVLDNRRVPVSAKERAQRQGSVPYYGATGQVGFIDKSIFDEDLVLLGEDGVQFFDPVRPKAYLISGPAWVNNHAHVLRPLRLIDREYLCHYLNQFNYRGFVNGTTRLKLTRASLNEIPVLLAPFAEQRRIVAALGDHFTWLNRGMGGVARLQGRLELIVGRLKESSVNGTARSRRDPATSGMGVIEPGISSTRVRKPNEHDWIPDFDLPDGWSWSSLGALSEDWSYGTSTRCAYGAAGAPVLRIPNVQRGEIDLSDMKHAVDSSQSLEGYYVGGGDVLFVRTNGSPKLIGRVAVVREAMQMAFASYLIRFRLRKDVVDPDWIALVVSSPLWRRYLERVAASSAGQYNLNSKQLANLPIPLPALAEQRAVLSEFTGRMSVFGEVQRKLKAAQLRGAALRRSLLVEAFAGRLVLQDPDDEPASNLLDQVRRDRAASLSKPRTRAVRIEKEPVAPPTRVTGDDYQQEALPL